MKIGVRHGKDVFSRREDKGAPSQKRKRWRYCWSIWGVVNTKRRASIYWRVVCHNGLCGHKVTRLGISMFSGRILSRHLFTNRSMVSDYHFYVCVHCSRHSRLYSCLGVRMVVLQQVDFDCESHTSLAMVCDARWQDDCRSMDILAQ